MNTVKTAAPPLRKNYRAVKQERPLIVTRAPHIQSSQTVSGRMWTLIFALVPVMTVAVAVYGQKALWVLFHSIISAVTFEFIAEKLFKRPVRILDGSAVLMGLILGLNLPMMAPSWMIWTGNFFTVFVARELAGGLGKNQFHPSLFGLAVLYFLYPVIMTHKPPLIASEFSNLVILFSGAFLMFKRVIHWQNSLTYLTAIAVTTLVFGRIPSFETFSPSILFASMFIITDSVTSPLTVRGQMIFALCAGILTQIIRIFIGEPEGMIFGILVMNGWVRFIDKHVTMRALGT